MKPDYRIKLLDKITDTRCNDAGAAWENDDGSINLVIAPGVTLSAKEGVVITLFPVNEKIKGEPHG